MRKWWDPCEWRRHWQMFICCVACSIQHSERMLDWMSHQSAPSLAHAPFDAETGNTFLAPCINWLHMPIIPRWKNINWRDMLSGLVGSVEFWGACNNRLLNSKANLSEKKRTGAVLKEWLVVSILETQGIWGTAVWRVSRKAWHESKTKEKRNYVSVEFIVNNSDAEVEAEGAWGWFHWKEFVLDNFNSIRLRTWNKAIWKRTHCNHCCSVWGESEFQNA